MLLILHLACAPDVAPAAPVTVTAVSAAPHPVQPSLLVVEWSQDGAAEIHVEYSFDAGVWLSSPARTLGAGAHQELLVGIPYGVEVTWRVVGAASPTADQVGTTGPAPEGLPVLTGLVGPGAEAATVDAPYLFTSIATGDFGAPWWRLIYDRQGRVVWARPSDPERASLHARVALDGRSLYLDQNTFWSLFDDGAASTIEQTLLDGSVVHTFATPGLHHPFTDLPDGSVAYGAVQGFYSDEILTEVARDGTITERWDCQEFLDAVGVVDRCGSNSLTYDPATDHYLYSFYSFESVVEIEASTGRTVRSFGQLPGSYAFDPVESAFWWQHGATFTPEGTLLLSSDLTDAGGETVVREYAVDGAAGALREVWSFGVGEGLYGEQMGEAVRLPGGNTWHNYGRLPRLREVTPAGEVVWDLSWEGTAIGRTMPIADLYALVGERD